jgi:hypothetical protein
LLDGWEAVRGQPMPVRAAAIAALGTGRPIREVMRWSLGRRDQALFAFYAGMFGDRFDAVTPCARCAEPLEMDLPLSRIRPSRRAIPPRAGTTIRIGRRRVRCRHPNTEDLLAVAASRDVDEARAALVARCVRTKDPVLRERAAARLADNASDVQLNLTCPACGHAWQAPFDIGTFAWGALDHWARRTLAEIHVIASVYGWSEDQILRLTAARRQSYVEMI